MESPDEILLVNKAGAALGQLETAIKLWFDSGDPVSIHALAVAASDCLHAIGKPHGKASIVQTWMRSLPRKDQDKLTAAQNFFKHGARDYGTTIEYYPAHGESLILDAILTYRSIFGKTTALMRVFNVRFALTNPDFVAPELPEDKHIRVDHLRGINRQEFLKEALLLFGED